MSSQCPSRYWRGDEAPLPNEPREIRNWHLCYKREGHDGPHTCTSCHDEWTDALANHWTNGPVQPDLVRREPCLDQEAYERAVNSAFGSVAAEGTPASERLRQRMLESEPDDLEAVLAELKAEHQR